MPEVIGGVVDGDKQVHLLKALDQHPLIVHIAEADGPLKLG